MVPQLEQTVSQPQLLCLLNLDFKRDQRPTRPLPQGLQVGAGAQTGAALQTGAGGGGGGGRGAGAGAQEATGAQPQPELLWKLARKRDHSPCLRAQGSSQTVPQPPPHEELVETTAGAGAGASLAGTGSAPTIQAEVSIIIATFTVINLPTMFNCGAGPGPSSSRHSIARARLRHDSGSPPRKCQRSPAEIADLRFCISALEVRTLSSFIGMIGRRAYHDLKGKRLKSRNYLAFHLLQRLLGFRKAAKDKKDCRPAKS